MLKSELEGRLGIEVSDEVYARYNTWYMMCAIGKDEFCQMLNDCEIDKIADAIAAFSMGTKSELKNRINSYKEKFATDFADIAQKYDDADARAKAISLMGKRAYARYILKSQGEIHNEDRAIIASLI